MKAGTLIDAYWWGIAGRTHQQMLIKDQSATCLMSYLLLVVVVAATAVQSNSLPQGSLKFYGSITYFLRVNLQKQLSRE